MLSVLLVDSDRAFARDVASWLRVDDEAVADLVHVERLRDALRLLRGSHLVRRKPYRADLIILNLSLPDGGGPAGLGRLLAVSSDTPVVVLTTQLSEQHRPDALRMGAAACLSKSSVDPDVFLNALAQALPAKRRLLKSRLETRSPVVRNDPGTEGSRVAPLLATSDEAVYSCDADGQVLWYNEVAAERYAFRDERNGRLRPEIYGEPSDDALFDLIGRIISGTLIKGERGKRRLAIGEVVSVVFSAFPVFDAEGKAIAAAFTERIEVVEAPTEETETPDAAASHQPAVQEGQRETSDEDEVSDHDDRPSILIVEDNDATRQMLKRMLEPHYAVGLASNPAEALTCASERLFDLLLLDISLGDRQTGLELLNGIRRAPSYRRVPAVACTAYALPGLSDRLLELGFDGYIAKPFSRQVLLETIEVALNRETVEKQAIVQTETPELDLPPAPGSLAAIVEMVSDKASADLERLTGVLETDPVVASWVLHHVNSAFYSFRGNVSTVERAVTLLGFEPICNLVLSRVLTRAFSEFEQGKPGLVYQYINRTSVATAAYARSIAEHLAMPNPELCFTAGLLHQLGRLGLMSMEPERYAALWFEREGASEEVPIPPSTGQELLHLGQDHEKVGVEIARAWELPTQLAFVIKRQNRISSRAVTPEMLMTMTVAAGSMMAARLYQPVQENDARREELSNILKILARRADADLQNLEEYLDQQESDIREFVGRLTVDRDSP